MSTVSEEEVSPDILVQQQHGGNYYLGQNIVDYMTKEFGKRSASTCDVRLYPGLVQPKRNSKFVRIHREVLAAASPLFKKLLMDLDPNQAKDVDVSLVGISYPDLQALVSFLYSGIVVQSKFGCETIATWLRILEIPAKTDIIGVEGEMGAAFAKACSEVQLQENANEKPKRVYKIDCKECGKVFRCRKDLEAHFRRHKGELLQCAECNKAFLHERDLKDHMNVHADESIRKKYYCPTCPKVCDTKKQLFNHGDSHRLTFEACPFCDRRMKNKATLRSHVREHLKRRVHKCDKCGYSTKRAADLQVHRRQHTGIEPYTCKLCNLRFGFKSSLTKHRCSYFADFVESLQQEQLMMAEEGEQAAELLSRQERQELTLIERAMEELAGEVVVEFEFQEDFPAAPPGVQ